MGQGTCKYRKIMRTPQNGENAGKKLWYAIVVSVREVGFEVLVTHISERNSPYSRGTIHGVLMDILDCLRELILDGKSVRLLYSITSQKLSGRLMFFISFVFLNNGAMSSTSKPAMPQPIGVTRK